MPPDTPLPETDPLPPFSGRKGYLHRQKSQEKTTNGRDRIAALRQHIGRIEGNFWPEKTGTVPLGIEQIDRHLPAGGLIANGLYEVIPAAPGDAGAATAFCAVLAARLQHASLQKNHGGTAVLWCLNAAATDAGEIYPPALARYGIEPGSLVALRAKDDATALQALEDALASGAPAVVIGEIGTASLTASRRLQLAAAERGIPALLLRPPGAAGNTSAALMRWRVASTPSQPRGWAAMLDEPGFPCWQTELFRCRGGAPGDWKVEWRDETGDLSLAAPLRDRPAARHAATA